jgi:3-hydroxyisobutyrate dehydrogenase
MKVAVIGLGQMGLGMATTLVGKGFPVLGFDVAEASRLRAVEAGVAVADELPEAIVFSDTVVLSLPDAASIWSVVTDVGGIVSCARPGRIVVDTSTSEASVSRAMADNCAKLDMGFLDAPVSGGPAGAKAGALTMMIGGDAAHVAAARPVLDALAARVIHVGGSGAGNVAKLVNNLLVAAHLLTVSEAMRLSEAAGVPAEDVLKVVNAASGRSAVSEVNYPRWIQSGSFDSGFTMGLMRKDVRLAGALVKETGLDLPMAALAARIWSESAARLADGEDFNRITQA